MIPSSIFNALIKTIKQKTVKRILNGSYTKFNSTLNIEIEFIIKLLSRSIIKNDAKKVKISLNLGLKFFISSNKPIKKKIEKNI